MKRQTQHRPTRDQKVVNKQVAELKRENQTLKRKVSRLQKYLKTALENQAPVEEPDQVLIEALQAPETDGSRCPDCKSQDVKTIQTPTSVLLACKCGWRRKQ